MMILTGTELFQKCTDRLQNPHITKLELNTVFHDLNAMLTTSFAEGDEHIATLWFTIGGCLSKMGHMVMALLCFQETLRLRPDFPEAINNAGYSYKKLNIHDKAQEYFKKVLDLSEENRPDLAIDDKSRADYYINYGSTFVCNGTPKEAVELFNKAEKFAPGHSQIKYNRGLAELELGDYEHGFDGYDYGDRLERIINRNYGRDTLPVWNGEKGKNIVVIGEQGIGDELMFGTIIPDVAKDCNIVIDAHPRLADMFRRSFPSIDVYGSRKHTTFEWGSRYPLDAKVLIGSLAKHYRKKEEDFPRTPWLIVDKKYDERYEERIEKLGERPKIGISWRGGTKQTGQNQRYIPLPQWLDILRLDCDFISLQYDHGIEKGIKDFCDENKVTIHHWTEMIEDYEQTAACIKHLDLVISVPQSVVHLAGVIGTIPTWQLCPVQSLWQCGVYGQDMPWYRNVNNYWQFKGENGWKETMDKVREDLCSLLQMNTGK